MKRSYTLITILIFLFFMSGCVSEKLKSDPQLDWAESQDLHKFTAIVLLYIERNNHLPEAKEELINFCSESNIACSPLDWNKFGLQKKDDGAIEITHKETNLVFPIRLLEEKEDTKKMEHLLFGEN